MLYIVQKGDTLYRIANKFGTTINCIKELNRLTSSVIYIGQQLLVSVDNFWYTVQPGDSLNRIANKYETTVGCIKEINNLTNSKLYVGQRLLINGNMAPKKVKIDVVYDSYIDKDIDIYRLNNSDAIFYTSKMAIDVDGATCSYNSADTGCDYLVNAGKDTLARRPDGELCTQGPQDPYPGYYVSMTSLTDGQNPNDCDYRKYVNSEEIPYIVLPGGWYSDWSIELGDFATVVNLNSPLLKVSHAIYADIGPASKIGEGSVALAEALGVKSDPKTGGIDDGILYIVYPGSGAGPNKLRTLAEIENNGEELFSNWGMGGMTQVHDLFPENSSGEV